MLKGRLDFIFRKNEEKSENRALVFRSFFELERYIAEQTWKFRMPAGEVDPWDFEVSVFRCSCGKSEN